MHYSLRSGFAAVFAAAVLVTGTTAMAADATGNASATVESAISIVETTAMNFGTFAPTASAGTVTIATTGARTSTNVDELASSPSAATFTVTGGNLAAYSITLPASSITLSDGGSETMSVDTFVSDAGGSPALNGSGSDTFNVGAVLTVGANQVAGSYTGTYTVTVNYN